MWWRAGGRSCCGQQGIAEHQALMKYHASLVSLDKYRKKYIIL